MSSNGRRDALVPVEVVIEHVGLSRSAFYALRHEGGGPPAYKIGKRLMFKWADVEAWIETKRDTPRPAA
jgi:predicted DNA-binding transcriptional regulator AlpA